MQVFLVFSRSPIKLGYVCVPWSTYWSPSKKDIEWDVWKPLEQVSDGLDPFRAGGYSSLCRSSSTLAIVSGGTVVSELMLPSSSLSKDMKNPLRLLCSINMMVYELPSDGIEYITVVEGNADIGTRITFPLFSGWYLGKGSCCMWHLALLWNSGGSYNDEMFKG